MWHYAGGGKVLIAEDQSQGYLSWGCLPLGSLVKRFFFSLEKNERHDAL